MKIAIVGTGYVGLVSGVCFAETGTDVTCIDINEEKIKNLQNGIIPIFEPGIEELVTKNIAEGRLHFATSLKEVINDVDIIFSAVGTPPQEDGSADLQYVLEVARTVGQNMNKYTVLVTKSTVPVGTAKKVRAVIQEELDKRKSEIDFDVASNPEFLKEGDAINDFMNPDRIVIGVNSDKSKELLSELYKPFKENNANILFMDIASAEMTKYASNSMLATRISFMNDIANLCEIIGADVTQVKKGIGSDTRIGSKFLNAGCGYGGSCFPKDVKALIHTARDNGYEMKILEAVETVNEEQKTVLYKKICKLLNADNLSGKTIALWGLSFKPNTDDLREATSLVLLKKLLSSGATVKVYDPIVKTLPSFLGFDEDIKNGNIYFGEDIYDTVSGCDLLCLVTEWKEFSQPVWDVIKEKMIQPILIDGRNMYNPTNMRNMGFTYDGIGVR